MYSYESKRINLENWTTFWFLWELLCSLLLLLKL